MLELMISEANNVLESLYLEKNDSYLQCYIEARIPIQLVSSCQHIDLILRIHVHIDFVDFEKPRALIIPTSV